jgi:hypothetical protein
MSEENPPAPSDADDASKAETIRITLPPKQEQQAVKRETVRINLPGRPVPPTGTTPKKETTKLPGGAAPLPPSPPSAPSIPSAGGAPVPPRPTAPPPPRPLSPGGSGGLTPAPPSLGKPSLPGGATPPPKPPSLGANRPSAPLKPAPAPGGAAPAAPGSAAPGAPAAPGIPGIPPKSAAPKKETARITLPPEGAKPSLPKATVKLGQTQPLVNRPSQTATPAAAITTVAAAPVLTESAPDSGATILSFVALAVSIVSFLLVFLTFNSVNS